jgi:hypothetical protein
MSSVPAPGRPVMERENTPQNDGCIREARTPSGTYRRKALVFMFISQELLEALENGQLAIADIDEGWVETVWAIQ